MTEECKEAYDESECIFYLTTICREVFCRACKEKVSTAGILWHVTCWRSVGGVVVLSLYVFLKGNCLVSDYG